MTSYDTKPKRRLAELLKAQGLQNCKPSRSSLTVATQPDWQLNEAHIYRDDGYSGTKLNRPGLDSAIADVSSEIAERVRSRTSGSTPSLGRPLLQVVLTADQSMPTT